jgi:diacylglycerol kinase family enzyme
VYGYIYDEFVQSPKFANELANIESRLTDLGLSGKVVRLALFRDPSEMIEGEVARGLTTVVAVGNDETARRVLDVVRKHDVVFGYIPLGSPTLLARLLGVPEGVEACDVLSGRIIEQIDLGVVNGKRFLSGLSIAKFDGEIVFDRFRVSTKAAGSLEVRNLAVGDVEGPEDVSDPRDGLLEAVLEVAEPKGWNLFKRTRKGRTVIPFTSMSIQTGHETTLVADGEEMTATQFDVSVEPAMCKVITGRSRMF